MQSSLFDSISNLLPHKGEAYLYPHHFSKELSDGYYKALLDEVNWKHEPIKLFGKEVMQPRLTAWYADSGKSYSYSGISMQGNEWTNTLLQIKKSIEELSQVTFNSALLNLYRDGQDSMGWHRDNEKELGLHPTIGSVSFGASRKFQLREYHTKDNLRTIDLDHGSFLFMCGETQPNWEHRVPKTTKVNSPRINITFRVLK
jgi:alkylated DNA repair dioxygenase AlkB